MRDALLASTCKNNSLRRSQQIKQGRKKATSKTKRRGVARMKRKWLKDAHS